MTIYLVGNELSPSDNQPHRLKPLLDKLLPDAVSVSVDPTEDFVPEEGSVIIDTVVGISEPAVWSSLVDFSVSPRISVHDYDLMLHLSLLQKIGKIKNFTLVGIPQSAKINEKLALQIKKIILTSGI